MNSEFDIIIIGAGPIGIACGIEAVKRNYSYLILEKGCLVNSLFHYPTNMIFFSTSERLEIGEVPFVSHGDKPTRREALEYYRRVVHSWKLNVKTYEKVTDIKENSSSYTIITEKQKYSTNSIIIATGFYDFPNMLNIPGENLPKVKHYFNEAHPYVYLNLVVIGGGNSAVDVALETYRRGSNVTMVIRESSLKEGVKYWVRPDIENRIKEGAIKAYFNSRVISIRPGDVDIETPDGKLTIKNDFVFAMTGYHPDFGFLRKAGITLSGEQIPDFSEETYETNKERIYLAGVVCGGMDTSRFFIENSRAHAEAIFNSLDKKRSKNLIANDK
ncbi:MAG TPA: YpdA family putative bacillithiol disulfide reductase [Ignavibacteriaceae bacterium]|nr:YpdA family putative bacillithiol disulfide reductase [Ignavibacteriaceae bacterium]